MESFNDTSYVASEQIYTQHQSEQGFDNFFLPRCKIRCHQLLSSVRISTIRFNARLSRLLYACVEKKSVTAGRTVTPARSFFRRKKYLKHSSHHAGCMNVALRLYLRQQVHHAVSSEGIHPIDRSLLDECIENNYTIPLCLWS